MNTPALSSSDGAVILDGVSLTCSELVRAANRKSRVILAKGAEDRIIKGREVVRRVVANGSDSALRSNLANSHLLSTDESR